MNRGRVKVRPAKLCKGLIHRATLGKLWIRLFSTRLVEYGLRKREGESRRERERERERGMERITEDLWCLSPPVRGPFLWQARKYFSNLSPYWHQCVTDTNMPPHPTPLTHPCPFTFPASLFICPVFKSVGNDAAHWKWWEQGEREREGRKMKRKRGIRPVPGAFRDSRAVEKLCARRLFIPLQRARFPGSAGVKHTQFGADLSPLISLA